MRCKCLFSEALIKFFEYINSMKPKDIPDYAKCRKIFEDYLKKQGVKSSTKLDFSNSKKLSKTKANISEDVDVTDSETVKEVQNGEVPKKRSRKAKVTPEVDTENRQPDTQKGTNKNNKRKSSEPIVVVNVKKTRLRPSATPPAKKNHTNIATQTSIEKLMRRSPRVQTSRHVSFDSPISEVVGDKNGDSINSSGDIFDDSFTIKEVKVKPKRKLLSKKEEEITIERVVKKKVKSVKKPKSWKDSATIVNGRSPPT